MSRHTTNERIMVVSVCETFSYMNCTCNSQFSVKGSGLSTVNSYNLTFPRSDTFLSYRLSIFTRI